MDYSKAIDSVAETISKARKPLTEAQRMLMAGAMAVWLEKAVTEEREECAKVCDDFSKKWPVDDNLFDMCASHIRMRSNEQGEALPTAKQGTKP